MRNDGLSSGPPGERPKPGMYISGSEPSNRNMLVFKAVKPRSRTCAPSLRMSSRLRTVAGPFSRHGSGGSCRSATSRGEAGPVPDLQASRRRAPRDLWPSRRRAHSRSLQSPVDETAPRLTRARIEVRRDALNRPRVLANQRLGELHDNAGQSLRAVTLVVFRPTDDPSVRLYLQEEKTRQPASACRSTMRVIFIEHSPFAAPG